MKTSDRYRMQWDAAHRVCTRPTVLQERGREAPAKEGQLDLVTRSGSSLALFTPRGFLRTGPQALLTGAGLCFGTRATLVLRTAFQSHLRWVSHAEGYQRGGVTQCNNNNNNATNIS